ncbi:MAG: bifunctional DNase/RNase [Planctomycetota bacterium]|jgi:bifunctional DNase/RNase
MNHLGTGSACSPTLHRTVAESKLIPVELARIVLHKDSPSQHIYLVESDGDRSFPIVIGTGEAEEIRRVVQEEKLPRPMTHKLALSMVESLGASISSADIVDLRKNTFFATLTLTNAEGEVLGTVDARASDAIALALRARCPLRVADDVLDRAAEEKSPE